MTIFNAPTGADYQIVKNAERQCVDVLTRLQVFDPNSFLDYFSLVVIEAQAAASVITTVEIWDDAGNIPSQYTPPGTVTAGANRYHGTTITYAFAPLNNTTVGTNVNVTPTVINPIGSSQVTLLFDSVSTTGNVTLSGTTPTDPVPPLPSGFQFGDPPTSFDLHTDATFVGSVKICVGYNADAYADETVLRLLHFDGGAWTDITSPGYPDVVQHQLCGQATSFSPFAVAQLHYDISGFFSPLNGSAPNYVENAGRTIPISFSLGGSWGSNIFASGYPQSIRTTCDFLTTIGAALPIISTSNKDLTYSQGNNKYSLTWKTDPTWRGTCRELRLRFIDGQIAVAHFRFT